MDNQPATLPDGRVIVGYDKIHGLPMVRETCDRCEGTGRRFDPTSMDRVDAGPFAGQCSPCLGAGERTVIVFPERPRVDAGEPVDPEADLGWWAEPVVPPSEPGRALAPDDWWRK
ncbi:MAG: hypothetical protein HOY78_02685 [Saccharothrix sp.]|nr:hypothetical protein [Saccharothrix sp.]